MAKQQGKREINSMDDVIRHMSSKLAKIIKNCEICGEERRLMVFKDVLMCKKCFAKDMEQKDLECREQQRLESTRRRYSNMEGF